MRFRSRFIRVIRGKKVLERAMKKECPLWEIFIRSQHGLAHRHVGSLHAPDAEMAIKNARAVYTRRNVGGNILAVSPPDTGAGAPSAEDGMCEPRYSDCYPHPCLS